MKALLACLLLLLCVSCLKTKEIMITQYDVCYEQRKFSDPDNLRDPYDSCLMMQSEYLKSPEGCEETCSTHCTTYNTTYADSWIDFSGCHCSCKRKL
jgi:hypothetical protein